MSYLCGIYQGIVLARVYWGAQNVYKVEVNREVFGERRVSSATSADQKRVKALAQTG
jgi:hypothetical protein